MKHRGRARAALGTGIVWSSGAERSAKRRRWATRRAETRERERAREAGARGTEPVSRALLSLARPPPFPGLHQHAKACRFTRYKGMICPFSAERPEERAAEQAPRALPNVTGQRLPLPLPSSLSRSFFFSVLLQGQAAGAPWSIPVRCRMSSRARPGKRSPKKIPLTTSATQAAHTAATTATMVARDRCTEARWVSRGVAWAGSGRQGQRRARASDDEERERTGGQQGCKRPTALLSSSPSTASKCGARDGARHIRAASSFFFPPHALHMARATRERRRQWPLCCPPTPAASCALALLFLPCTSWSFPAQCRRRRRRTFPPRRRLRRPRAPWPPARPWAPTSRT